MIITYCEARQRYEAQVTYAERQLARSVGLQRDPDTGLWHTTDIRVAYKLRGLADPDTQGVIDVAIAAKWAADRGLWDDLVPHDGARLARLTRDRQEAERVAFEQQHAVQARTAAQANASRRGRPPVGEHAMSGAQRMQASRARRDTSTIEITAEIAALLRQVRDARGSTSSATMRAALDALEREAAKQAPRAAEIAWFQDVVCEQSSVQNCPSS